MEIKTLLFPIAAILLLAPVAQLASEPRPRVVEFCLGLDWDGVCRRWVPYGITLHGAPLDDFELTDETCREGWEGCRVFVIRRLTRRDDSTPATRIHVEANCLPRSADFRYWDPREGSFLTGAREINRYHWHSFTGEKYFDGSRRYDTGEPVWRFTCTEPQPQQCYVVWGPGGPPQTIIRCNLPWKQKAMEVWLNSP